MIKRYIVILLLLSLLLTLGSCGKGEDVGEDSADMTLDYSDVDVRSFVKSATYKGLTVTLADESDSKESVLWDAILANVQTEDIWFSAGHLTVCPLEHSQQRYMEWITV